MKVEKFQKPETLSWGPMTAWASGGFRATPWPGVQGARGPRKLLALGTFQEMKMLFPDTTFAPRPPVETCNSNAEVLIIS